MKSKEKLFTVAGTATYNGLTKARFANDLVARIKILTKNGFTAINLVELPKPMTKVEALQHLQTLGLTGDAGFAVANKLADKTKVAKAAVVRTAPAKKTVTVKGASKAKTTVSVKGAKTAVNAAVTPAAKAEAVAAAVEAVTEGKV